MAKKKLPKPKLSEKDITRSFGILVDTLKAVEEKFDETNDYFYDNIKKTDKRLDNIEDVNADQQKDIEELKKKQKGTESQVSDLEDYTIDLDDRIGAIHKKIDSNQQATEKKLDGYEQKQKKSDDRLATVEKKASMLVNAAARNAAAIKSAQNAQPQGNSPPISALASSMNIIATSLGIMNKTLSKVGNIKAPTGGTIQVEAPAPTGTPAPQKQEGGDVFGMLKGLFTNPAVAAALAGIVYTVLPKDTQEKIKAFLGGFVDGIGKGFGDNEESGLGTFNTALKAAGIAIATVFGAKMLTGILDAITTVIKVTRMIGGKKALAVVGGVAAVAGVAMVMGKKKEGEDGGEEGAAAAPAGAPSPAGTGGGAASGGASAPSRGAAPAAAPPPSGSGGTGLKQGGGTGLKPGGGVGLKLSGTDGAVMKAAEEVGITNKYAQIALLANVQKESGGVSRSEDLAGYANTSNDRIRKIFTTRVQHLTDDELNKVKKDPYAFGELIYGKDTKLGRGMGNTEPGDGFKYRGRGLIGITGKDNYKFYSKMIGVDLVANPDLANDPVIAAKIAAAYMIKTVGLNKLNSFTNQAEANRALTQAVGGRGLNLDVGIGAEILGKVDKFAGMYEQALGSGGSTMMASAPSTGTTLNTTSQNVKDMQRPGGSSTQVASVDGSRTTGMGSQGDKPQLPIPSPIAGRGSLNIGTKHSTAYA